MMFICIVHCVDGSIWKAVARVQTSKFVKFTAMKFVSFLNLNHHRTCSGTRSITTDPTSMSHAISNPFSRLTTVQIRFAMIFGFIRLTNKLD